MHTRSDGPAPPRARSTASAAARLTEHVVAVKLDARDSIRLGSHGQILTHTAGLPDRCRHPVAIVLADVHYRQLPYRGHVDRLVESPLVGCPVAKEAGSHLAGSPLLCRKHRTGRDGDPPSDDSVGPQHAQLEIGNVQRPAFALAVASRPPNSSAVVRHTSPAPGDEVTVAPVSARDGSSLCRAAQTPVAIASSPRYRCTKPGCRPWR